MCKFLDEKKCWLKDASSMSRKVQYSNGISGAKNCFCTDNKCVADNTGYSSNSIGSLNSFDLTKEECSCICDGNQQCQAWTFSADLKTGKKWCSLHASADQPQYRENSIAGAKSCKSRCTTSMSSDKKCTWNQISISSDKITSLSSQFMTKEECSCSCKDNIQCQAWTFTAVEKGFSTCDFFSSAVAFSNSTNSVSGTNSCESCKPKEDGSVHAETNKTCNLAGVAVQGELLKEFMMESQSFKECSCECQKNPNCVGWSARKGMY